MVNNFQGRNRNANYQQQQKDFTRYPTLPHNYQYISFCANCAQRWTHYHQQICPAKGKNYKDCGILGHFTEKCRKPKKQQAQTSKILSNKRQSDQHSH